MIHNYKPLPNNVKLKPSSINGLGLFATETIEEGTNLGISHVLFKNKLERTPLGGFVNHSDNFNIEMLPSDDGESYFFEVIRNIKPGEEIVINYMMTPCIDYDGDDKLNFK